MCYIYLLFLLSYRVNNYDSFVLCCASLMHNMSECHLVRARIELFYLTCEIEIRHLHCSQCQTLVEVTLELFFFVYYSEAKVTMVCMADNVTGVCRD